MPAHLIIASPSTWILQGSFVFPSLFFSKIKCSPFSSGSSKTFVRSWHLVIPFCLGCVGGKKKMGSLPDSPWHIIYQRRVQCYLLIFFCFFKQRQVCLWLLRRKFIKEDKTFSKLQGQHTQIHLKPKLLQVFHYVLQRSEETSKTHLQGQTYKETGASQMNITVGFLRLQSKEPQPPFLAHIRFAKKRQNKALLAKL